MPDNYINGERFVTAPHPAAETRLERVAEVALDLARRHHDWLPGDRLVVLATGPDIPAARRTAPGHRVTAVPMATMFHGYPVGPSVTTGRLPLADILIHAVYLARATGMSAEEIIAVIRRYI